MPLNLRGALLRLARLEAGALRILWPWDTRFAMGRG